MPIPKSWVDALFAKLSIRYGAAFLRQWPDADPEIVKADWADVLGGFDGAEIKHALDHLPADKPPTAGQFRVLCNAAPVMATLALSAPLQKPSPAVLERIASVGVVAGDPREWARRLKRREESGEKLTAAQRSMWRTALESEAVA